jgi:succinate dehydrogenase flavin-adding protein (antitoxin of CptAB toxin-antitoxin module)
MLELDLILSRFLDERLESLNAEQREALANLLQLPDNDLWDMVIGRAEAPDLGSAEIIHWLR